MGLLDDAIREHLELKRRRGADPGEIAREESEALGPVRREAPAEPAPAATDEDFGSYADHEPAELEEPAAAYDDFGFEDAPAPAPSAYEDHAVPSDPPASHDAPYAERGDASSTPPHGDPFAEHHHQATREFSATELGEALGHHEAATPPHGDPLADAAPPTEVTPPAGAAAEGEADDELGDTPDFLQETPEHDRLWFEQKPPKDFDF